MFMNEEIDQFALKDFIALLTRKNSSGEYQDVDYDRGLAALALGNAGCVEALESLIGATMDGSVWVRGWAIRAIGLIHEEQGLQALGRALSDNNAWVREGASDALAGFDSELADDVLRSALASSSPVGRSWAIHTMGRRTEFGDSLDIIPLLEDENRAVRLSAVRALYRLGGPEAVRPIMMFMNDKDEHLRGASSYALGRIGDAESVPHLIYALRDAHSWVRRNAAWSLLQLGESLDVVASLTEDSDRGVRAFASKAVLLLKNSSRDGYENGDHDEPKVRKYSM